MKWQDANFDFSLPVRYFLGPENKAGLVVLLHGYQDHAYSYVETAQLVHREDLPFQILASNVTLPGSRMDRKRVQGSYSWYFRDTSRGLTLVPPQTTAARVANF